MKKILLTAILLIGTLTGFGQRVHDYNPESRGVFNVMDYGAVSGDAVDDAAAINAAVMAAAAYSAGYFGDGKVIIPPGNYVISDSIHLLSNVHIDIATGAYFNVGIYDGPVFYAEDEILQFATVSGGIFYSSSRLYTGLQFVQTVSEAESYVAFCTFKNTVFHGCNIGIDFECSNIGWVNSNYFENILISDYITGIEATVETNAGSIYGNTFNHLTIQSGVDTEFGLKDFQGSGNTFIGMVIWDLPVGAIGATISGVNNLFIGGYVPSTGFEDNSTSGNINFSANKQLITPSHERFWVYDTYADRDSIDKIRITSDLEPGTAAAPSGDIGIKLGFASAADAYGHGIYKNSANNSARIVADFTYPGSRLKFQTHNQTPSTTQYNNVMILDQNGGVSYPIKSTGTITDATGIVRLMISRFMYYSEAAATDITANPQIVDDYDGQIITIIGSSDTNTLTLDDGDGLSLSGQCVLGVGDTITLIYSPTLDLWVEQGRSNN